MLLGIKHKSSNEFLEPLKKQINNEQNAQSEDLKIISKKPLWIGDVKETMNNYFSSTSKNVLDLEEISELFSKDNQKVVDINDYPYYTTIRKIMYSYGDKFDCNTNTVIYMHDFIKNFIINFSKIILECDFKKIVEHFFGYESEKFHSYKKLKFKNNLIIGEAQNENNCNNPLNNDVEIDDNDIIHNQSESKMNVDNSNNINNDEEELSEGIENDELEFDYIKPLINMNNQNDIDNNKITYNPFIDKSSYYTENIEFQCDRTENMDTKEYIEYNSCRQHNFLSNGKKEFSIFLQNIIGEKNFPSELKEFNNVELLCFILKEEIRKIVTNAIKNKHPNKKLFILSHPLEVKDISSLCEKEIESFKIFFSDYQSNYFLINEFKKKDLNKYYSNKNYNYNKNTKVKKGEDGSLYLIIKKYCFIKNNEESSFLKNNKKKSELQVMNGLLILKDKYIQIRNNRKRKNQFLINNKSFMSVKDWVNFLGIDNFYEYFLIKDYINDTDISNIKSTDINNKITLINKVNKKKIGDKFNEWINMDEYQKETIKKEFEGYLD